jgi:hypothetical protein
VANVTQITTQTNEIRRTISPHFRLKRQNNNPSAGQALTRVVSDTSNTVPSGEEGIRSMTDLSIDEITSDIERVNCMDVITTSSDATCQKKRTRNKSTYNTDSGHLHIDKKMTTSLFTPINVEEGNFDDIAKGNFSIPQSNNGPKDRAEASSSKTQDRQPAPAVEQAGATARQPT